MPIPYEFNLLAPPSSAVSTNGFPSGQITYEFSK